MGGRLRLVGGTRETSRLLLEISPIQTLLYVLIKYHVYEETLSCTIKISTLLLRFSISQFKKKNYPIK